MLSKSRLKGLRRYRRDGVHEKSQHDQGAALRARSENEKSELKRLSKVRRLNRHQNTGIIGQVYHRTGSLPLADGAHTASAICSGEKLPCRVTCCPRLLLMVSSMGGWPGSSCVLGRLSGTNCGWDIGALLS